LHLSLLFHSLISHFFSSSFLYLLFSLFLFNELFLLLSHFLYHWLNRKWEEFLFFSFTYFWQYSLIVKIFFIVILPYMYIMYIYHIHLASFWLSSFSKITYHCSSMSFYILHMKENMQSLFFCVCPILFNMMISRITHFLQTWFYAP
jgi:hypothetical protein